MNMMASLSNCMNIMSKIDVKKKDQLGIGSWRVEIDALACP